MTELYRRDFPAELLVRRGDDGEHYAEGLCVPYGVATDITEVRDGVPIRYREQFAAGAFARAMRAPHRVTLAYGHSNSFGDRLGFVTELTEDSVGLRMKVKLDRSRAEQALDALSSSHSALSVAFAPIVPRYGTEEPGQLVIRTSVHLDHIAAVTQGAYDLARLTSVRGDNDPDPDPTPAEIAAAEEEQKRRELAAWLETLNEDPWAGLRA
jgi:HK97 family phage prohead protease